MFTLYYNVYFYPYSVYFINRTSAPTQHFALSVERYNFVKKQGGK